MCCFVRTVSLSLPLIRLQDGSAPFFVFFFFMAVGTDKAGLVRACSRDNTIDFHLWEAYRSKLSLNTATVASSQKGALIRDGGAGR